MTRHQNGIFTEGTRSHQHLELSVLPEVTDAAIRAALVATRTAAADHRTAGGVALVVSLGPDLARRLWDGSDLPELRSFPGYRSPSGQHEAPATQHDVWVWMHGTSYDEVLDVAREVLAAWSPLAVVEVDKPGFVYHDSRDLTGFIDGTANPRVDDAPAVARIAEGQPGAGGCCGFSAVFRHDLATFDRLPVEDQERVIGRTKPDSVQLRGAELPEDAHVARAEVADDHGEELKVYRRSVPWATAAEHGLYFCAFGSDLDRFDLQLRSMYGLADDGVTDRLLDFTTALTGSFWFTPAVEALDAIAPVEDEED